MSNVIFDRGHGCIVGSFINIEYGDTIKSINAQLSHVMSMNGSSTTNQGRLVTAKIWPVDENFINLFNSKKIDINTGYQCSNIISNNSMGDGSVVLLNGVSYVNTNQIPYLSNREFTFEFIVNPIYTNRIFFAFISTPIREINNEYFDVTRSSLAFPTAGNDTLYFRNGANIENTDDLLLSKSYANINTSIKVIHLSGTGDNYGTSIKPNKIECTSVEYRTLSSLDNNAYNGGKESGNDGWTDGGEETGDINGYKYIINTNNNVVNDYTITANGRLRDISFLNPNDGEYLPSKDDSLSDSIKNNENIHGEPRWVFKRSQIKFTIPPVRNNNNQIINRKIRLRYRVYADIHSIKSYNGKSIYKNEYVYVDYDQTQYPDGYTIVICPRDEGILDNTDFSIVFDRAYSSSINYSEQSTYKFHTFQKPVVNIAYPKLIRNNETGTNFKYAQILTTNMFSNFKGENAVVNKYVCDTLPILIGNTPPDNSGIPMFVRFNIQEYKYGRNGRLQTIDGTETAAFKSNDSALAVFNSENSNDYVSLNDILTNKTDKRTAYMSSIVNCDGSPIILSGRYSKEDIEFLGKNYKLWTLRTWDYIDTDNDVRVGNAWPSEDIDEYTPPTILGDHAGKTVTTIDENTGVSTTSQPVNNALLFRAGYIYCLKIRMFHGAAAGAIFEHYSNTIREQTIFGIHSNNSGRYNYTDGNTYEGQYPVDDSSQYGNTKPYFTANSEGIYKQWLGPDDGTTGLALNDAKVNQTYPGFSEADYSIIEPVCPYTSRNNLITVHPSSPQIGANQWLTFNYRHLSKNLAAVDTWAMNDVTKENEKAIGHTYGGTENTLTRILAMHNSAIYNIISKLFEKGLRQQHTTYDAEGNPHIELLKWSDSWPNDGDCKSKDEFIRSLFLGPGRNIPSGAKLKQLNLTVEIAPVEKYNQDVTNGEIHVAASGDFTKPPSLDRTHNPLILNSPLLNANDCSDFMQKLEFFNEKDSNGNIINSCGLYWYNEWLLKYKDTAEKILAFEDSVGYNWPEPYIVYRKNTSAIGNTSRYRKIQYPEPLGNTYRWQPVINATNGNGSELNIENKEDDTNKKIDYDLIAKEMNGYYVNSILKHSDQLTTTPNNNLNSYSDYPIPDTLEVSGDNGNIYSYLLYADKYGGMGNDKIIQKYFYQDINTIDNIATSSANGGYLDCPHSWDPSTNKRFCVAEFAGELDYSTVNPDVMVNSPHPVMYTTVNYGSDIYNEDDFANKSFQFFSLNKDNSAKNNSSYGQLFKRVPVTQDCENGVPTVGFLNNVGNANFGGLAAKRPVKVDINDDANNIYPLVRTTHYLFFKTHIAMGYEVSLSAQFDYTDDEGHTHHYYFGFPFPETMGDYDHYSTYKVYFKGDKNTSNTGDVTYYNTPEDMFKCCNSSFPNNSGVPTITFGNNGIVEVFGEDNNNWGKCLSADDKYAYTIKKDGTANTTSTSGGIEVPIMVRYTPLLQPQVASESYNASGELRTIRYGGGSSKSVSVTWYREARSTSSGCNPTLCVEVTTNWDHMVPVIKTVTHSSGGGFTNNEMIEITGYDLNIYYPYIPENNLYYTVSPNAGNPSQVFYEGYYIDVDTDSNKNLLGDNNGGLNNAQDKDCLGGYGICTSYTVLLVPSDPDLSTVSSTEKQYFTNTNGHWNFFKQPSNYYSKPDIFNIRSKTIVDAGPVIIAYHVKCDDVISAPNNSYTNVSNVLDYTKEGVKLPNWWTVENDNSKGRALKTIKINFKDLLEGKFETSLDSSTLNSLLGSSLTDANKLKVGLTYDLVIIPIYSNYDNKKHCFTDGGGSINTIKYAGGDHPSTDTHMLCGSNPFVLYNYLFVAKAVAGSGSYYSSSSGSDAVSYDTNYTESYKECSNCDILNTDHAIIFPNIDHELFNKNNGTIKEPPGFWLNNSFKLVLRMPSFRTRAEAAAIGPVDFKTIDQMSNGILSSDSGNIANDFEFDDIQIHIGKISELEEYGYPYNMENNLNKLNTKEELAKAHIISYKHYWDKGVFSKKLREYSGMNSDIIDNRDKVTGGSLNPDGPYYNNRFIEVNLSNATIMKKIKNNDGTVTYQESDIYTEYPEGFYIQFRWKSAYGGADETLEWSDWHGGSYNGGKNWWGDKGLSYFVPVRNYTDIYTDFRNYIKESYPGSLITTSNQKVIGQGTTSTLGSSEIINNRLYAEDPPYHHVGTGNVDKTTLLVPSIKNNLTNIDQIKDGSNAYNYTDNNDDVYHNDINYLSTHDKEFTIPSNITNMSQQMWEMLYVDYIIRNMSKLYYKPKHNDTISNNSHLAAPKNLLLDYKGWGWDDMELKIDENKSNSIQDNGMLSEYPINNNRTVGPTNTITNRQKWDINKYYRTIIKKQDFDELNKHLQNLVEFIRNTALTGKHVNSSIFGNYEVIPKPKEILNFNRSRKMVIGHDLTSNAGQGTINNINHSMIDSNYIRHIWENILQVCQPGDLQSHEDIHVNY